MFKPKENLTYKIVVGRKENLVTNEYNGFIEKPENVNEFLVKIRNQF